MPISMDLAIVSMLLPLARGDEDNGQPWQDMNEDAVRDDGGGGYFVCLFWCWCHVYLVMCWCRTGQGKDITGYLFRERI